MCVNVNKYLINKFHKATASSRIETCFGRRQVFSGDRSASLEEKTAGLAKQKPGYLHLILFEILKIVFLNSFLAIKRLCIQEFL